MAVKVNGSKGLNFVGSFDISEIEAKSKKVMSLIANMNKEVNSVGGNKGITKGFNEEQHAMQNALASSRVALQKLKEEQQSQRNEQEKSRAAIAASRAEVERLKVAEQDLNSQYKAGKVALAQYNLEAKKIADSQLLAIRAQKEADRALKEQIRLQKEQEKQAERNRKQLEKESSEYYKLSTALGNVRKSAKDVLAEMFRLEREGLQTSEAYKQLEIRSKALTAETNILDKGIKRIDTSLGLHQRHVGDYGRAIEGLSPHFAYINQQLGLFGTSIDTLASQPAPFKALTASLMAFGRAALAFMVTPIGAIMTALAGLYALISGNKQTVIDFNSGLLDVSKTTGIAGEDLTKLGDSVISLSNELKSVSTKQLLEYAKAAGQLGVTGSANILRFAETMAKLEIASNVSGEEGAEDIARLLNLTDQGVENVSDFASELVNLGNSFAANEKDILANASRIAQSTGLYKIGRQEVLAYAVATKAVGLQSEVVGSALGRTFGAMEKATRTGENIKTFATVTGKSVEELKKSFKDDASGTFNAFIKGLNGVYESGGSVQGVLQSLSITSAEDTRVIATLASNGYGTLKDALDAVGQSAGALDREFETANSKLENVGKRIGIAWDNLVLSFENGQGIIAKTGAYLGNTFADILVNLKKGVDELGLAFAVEKQYAEDFSKSMHGAKDATYQYADSLSGIKKLFDGFSIEGFLRIVKVDIPNALYTSGAYFGVLTNTVKGFIKFLSVAGPSIGKYIKDALNPFAKADSSGIDALANNFIVTVKKQNADILAEVEKTNKEHEKLFKERYANARNAIVEGEKLAAGKGSVNGAFAAAIEAEMAEADAVTAASKNKAKAAQEAAVRAQEAAKRAATEAAVAGEKEKEEADKAAARADKAAQHAIEVANQVTEAINQQLAARRALQNKIDELNKEANRKQLSQHEQDIQQVHDKYAAIQKEIDAFYRNPKNAGVKVDASGLGASKKKEIDTVNYRQETTLLKSALEEQKRLFTEYEEHRKAFGIRSANERYAGELEGFRTYLQRLKSEQDKLKNKGADLSGPETERLKEIEDRIKQEELLEQKKYLDLLKNLKNYEEERNLIIEEYQRKRLQLLQNGAVEAVEILDQVHKKELAAYDDAEIKRSDIYKKATEQLSKYTAEAAKSQIAAIKEVLKNERISAEERAELIKEVKALEKNLAEYTAKKTVEALMGVAGALRDAAGLMSKFDQQAAKAVNTVANIAEGVASIAGGLASGNPLAVISGAVAAMTAIYDLIDNTDEIQARNEAARQKSLEKTQQVIESINRLLDQQAKIIDRAMGTDRIDAFNRQIKLITSDLTSVIQRINQIDLSRIVDQRGVKRLVEFQTTLKNLVQEAGRPVRGGGAGGTLKTINEVIEANRKEISNLYSLLESGVLDGDTEQLRELLNTYEQLEQQLEEYRNRLKQVITGTTVVSIVDSLADGFKKGYKSAADFADNFEELMKNAIIQSLKMQALEKPLQEFYDQLAVDSESGGGLDSNEIEKLKELYEGIITNAGKRFEELQQIAGLDFGQPETSKQGSLQGAFKALTEDTAGQLVGQFNGQRIATLQGLHFTRELLTVGQQNTALFHESINLHRMIEVNTRNTVESILTTNQILTTKLTETNAKLTESNSKLSSIDRKTDSASDTMRANGL